MKIFEPVSSKAGNHAKRLGLLASVLILALMAALLIGRDNSARRDAQVDPVRPSQGSAESFVPLSTPDAARVPNIESPDPAVTTERPAFVAFADWMTRYQQASAPPALVREGIDLARGRAVVMKALIQDDPATALGLALSTSAQSSLPSEVRAFIEQPVHGQGRLNVDGVVPLPSGELPERAVIRSIVTSTSGGSQEYSAYVYGGRVHELSAVSTEFEGVVLENQLAVYDHGDFPTHGASCDQCKGGSGYGPGSAAQGDASAGSSDVISRPSLAWSTGAKKVLIIRVDFSDLPGDPVSVPGGPPLTQAFAESEFTKPGGYNDFYFANSYGKTSLLATATPVLYRMPQTAAYYAQGDGSQSYSGKLRDAARAAAAADHDLSTYDRIGVVCTTLSGIPGSKTGFAGVANISGADFLINGYYDFKTVVHELGHTYGVHHANWWKPANNAIIGTERELLNNLTNGENYFISLEYQDDYDIMGALNGVGPGPTLHFNHWFKNLLGWIPDSNVQSITEAGTYRIYRFDDGLVDPATHSMALKIGRDERRDFWVGFRRQASVGTNISTGASILFGYNFNAASDLLACNSPGVNVKSAGLQVGQTLVDAAAGITISTVALGGVAPAEYLDIAVSFQSRASFTRRLFPVDTTPTTALASVTVERVNGSSGITTVNYATADGTALAGTHFTASSGALTWADGDTTPRVITIPILAPYAASLGAKDFTVKLSGAGAGIISTTTVSLCPPGNPDFSQISGRTNGSAQSVTLQADGKLLVVGNFPLVGDAVFNGIPTLASTPAGSIARFNPDGTLDKTFNAGLGLTGDYNVAVVRTQPDGKILVGGSFTNFNNASPARKSIVRLNSDGSLDPSFAAIDLSTVFSASYTDRGRVESIVVQSDGKIVIAGGFHSFNGTRMQGLCRLNPDGSPDFLFSPPTMTSSGGQLALALGQYSAALGGPRIYAVGTAIERVAPGYKFGVTCLRPDGTPDPSFQIGQGALTTLGGYPSGELRSIAVQSDGKILIGGNFGAFNTSAKATIVRLNTDGSVDESFTAPPFTSPSYLMIYSLLAQPDGKIVVGGSFNTVGGLPHKNLIRLTSTGEIDPEWDNGTGNKNGSYMTISSLNLQPNGRVMAAGGSPYSIRGSGSNFQALFTGLPSTYGTGRFGIASYSVSRGSAVQVSVERVGGGTGAVQVDYGTQPGTALAGTDYVATAGTLSWADGDTSPKTILVQCQPGAPAGRSFRLNLVTPNGGLLVGSIPSTVVTIGGGTNYEEWRTQNFSAAQQADESLSGPAASFSGDGIANLLKYALGLTPTTPLVPEVDTPASLATGRLSFAFTRDSEKTDLTYEVQATDDLVTWTPIARSTAGAASVNLGAFSVDEAAGEGTLFRVTVTDGESVASSGPGRFLRLKVTK